MRTGVLSLAVVLLGGCSSASSRTISGQLDLTQLRPSNAQVVALSSSGRAFRAPISASGAFSISLPTHASYTMRFANATTAAGRYDAFATLAPLRPTGATHWFALTDGAAIDLGRVARAGVGAARPSGLQPASDPAGGDDTEMAGGEQEDDGAEACDLSGGADDADVTAEHDLNDAVDSDHDGEPDSVDSDNSATCSATGTSQTDDCELSDSAEHDLDDVANQPCRGNSGGGPGAPAPVPGLR